MSYTPIAVPPAFDRHVINRFSFGYTPTLRYEVQKAGGALKWFDKQLYPAGIADPAGDALWGLFPHMAKTPLQILAPASPDAPINPGVNHQDAAYNTCMRAVSKRQVLEVMHDFWRNLFYVSITAPATKMAWFVPQFDAGMRKRALTNFPSILRFAEKSGAMRGMLSSLNQPNENHPRELLELHTVGVGKYTEDDVKNLLKVFSGWAYHLNADAPWYEGGGRMLGPVKVLGFTHPNDKREEGPLVLDKFLTYIADHPATRYAVCKRLAKRFVADNPPYSLVVKMCDTWKRTGGDIKSILRTLVRSSEFRESMRTPMTKVPHYDFIGTLRHKVASFDDASDMANLAYWNIWTMGDAAYGPYLWGMPNGLSERSADWATPSIVIAASRYHWNLLSEECRGYWNKPGATFRDVASFWPRRVNEVSVANLIDHQCRRVWGRPATPMFIESAAKVLGKAPTDTVTKDIDPKAFWWMLTSVFDAPEWMGR